MGFVSLDYIVRNVLVSLEESSLNRYQTYLQYAIRGFRELNLHASNTLKIAYLPILSNKAVNLPSDFVKYTKIGVCVNGRIVLLGLDDSLCLNKDFNDCGDALEIAIAPNVPNDTLTAYNFGYYFLDHYHNGQYVGGIYGLGGGYNGMGYYRLNPEANQIQLTSNIPSTEIVLEYISDGLNPDGSASIPKETIEAMIAYVHWKRVQNNPKMQQEAELRRRDYIVEYNKLKHFTLSFSVQEYLQMIRTYVHSAPKR